MTKSLMTSTLTDRYQTTIPEAVRQQLGLGKRDQIEYRIEDGQVVISRAQQERDPALVPFLALLQQDIQVHPEHLQLLDAPLRSRLNELTGNVQIDLDAPLAADDE